MEDYVPPCWSDDGFNCPHCGAYAHQEWFIKHTDAHSSEGVVRTIPHLFAAFCSKCRNYSLWISEQEDLMEEPRYYMLFPIQSNSPKPNDDMPDSVNLLYIEAMEVVNRSPRAAAALLRLAVQVLCKELGQPGKNINDDIKTLVEDGLPPVVQQSLDALRVIGNNAVHPGEIDVGENPEMLVGLFTALNVIVEQMISIPKQTQALYELVPEGAKKAIEKRDAQ